VGVGHAFTPFEAKLIATPGASSARLGRRVPSELPARAALQMPTEATQTTTGNVKEDACKTCRREKAGLSPPPETPTLEITAP